MVLILFALMLAAGRRATSSSRDRIAELEREIALARWDSDPDPLLY